jgi:hypothetical protein
MPIPQHWPPHVQERARQFLALLKYYWFSRTLSESALPFVQTFSEGTPQSSGDKMRAIALLGYWIASLHVLCEGWTTLGLADTDIDGLLTDEHRNTLRSYRHTVFHFQADLDEKRIGALASSHDAVSWVFELGEAFQGFFERHSEAIDVEHVREWLFTP